MPYGTLTAGRALALRCGPRREAGPGVGWHLVHLYRTGMSVSGESERSRVRLWCRFFGVWGENNDRFAVYFILTTTYLLTRHLLYTVRLADPSRCWLTVYLLPSYCMNSSSATGLLCCRSKA